MVLITKSEKEAIVERYPNVHIVRTMKQRSARHRYYMVEDREPMRYLMQLRGIYREKKRSNNNHGGGRGHRREYRREVNHGS